MDMQVLLCYLLMIFIAGVILGTNLLERSGYKHTARINRIALIIYGLLFLSINIGLWLNATYG